MGKRKPRSQPSPSVPAKEASASTKPSAPPLGSMEVVLKTKPLQPVCKQRDAPKVKQAQKALTQLEVEVVDEQELLRQFDQEMAGTPASSPVPLAGVDDQSQSPEERIQVVRDMYLAQVRALRAGKKRSEVLESRYLSLRMDNLAMEDDIKKAQAETHKLSAMATRLQKLCVELQDQNKALLSVRAAVSEQDEKKSLSLSQKFNDVIKGIADRIEEDEELRKQQIEENKRLRDELQAHVKMYEEREASYSQMLASTEARGKEAESKHKSFAEMAEAERAKVERYQARVTVLSAQEDELRVQMNEYAQEFNHFQEGLTASNKKFAELKGQMESHSKAIMELEEEKTALLLKKEKSTKTLKDLSEEQEKNQVELASGKAKNEELEALCRTLQVERQAKTHALSELKARLNKLMGSLGAPYAGTLPVPT